MQADRSSTISILIISCICIFNHAFANDAKLNRIITNESEQLERALLSVVQEHNINTAGIGIIQNGVLGHEYHFGMQNEGTVASSNTLYNVASITKTVTAETVIRLASKGRLDINESMSQYWVDQDLLGSPMVHELTPRMSLSHTTGFMNWRFYSDDNKLKFVSSPGAKFGYSGEGFNYLARYAEKKLKTTFEALAEQEIFTSLSMQSAFMSVDKSNYDRIAKPLDKKHKFHGHYCYPSGYCRSQDDFSAAGDMVITVGDYAKFLIDAMQGNGLSKEIRAMRDEVQTVSYAIDCSASPEILCPTKLGYSLGWNVTELENDTLIGHSGSDWSMVTLTYYYNNSKDGLIVFLNAPNDHGIAAMVEILTIIDPKSPKLHEYIARLKRVSL